MTSKKLAPISPGEILIEEFLEPLNLSMSQLAKEIRVPINRIHQIAKAHREITPDTALRLSCFFNTSPEFWLNLQNHYTLELLEGKRLLFSKEIIPFKKRKAA